MLFGWTKKNKKEHYSSLDFLRYAEECLNLKTVYLWGGMGEVLTSRLLERLIHLYPDTFDREKISCLSEFVDKDVRGFDCSGLLKRFVMGGLKNYKYIPERDLNSLALFELSGKKGEMDSLPERQGICLYMEGHTGIYVGNGQIIESTPNPCFGDGVVKTHISDRKWENWYEMPWVDYGE